MNPGKTKKRPPYDFIIEELGSHVTDIKPMFGAYGVYRDNQILMILRKKEKPDQDTGLWLGIPDEHIASIKTEFPDLRDLEMFGRPPTAWQVLGEDLESFEEIALKLCELIKSYDPRIGRTPKKKLRKTQVRSRTKKKF